ncbi:MAG TPA: class I SAM-dependent methyltransferase [Herpetosiphonaceae bacterium]
MSTLNRHEQDTPDSRFAPHPHRQFWDTRYRDSFYPRWPSALLERWLTRLTPGYALDVACGAGRHTLLLAQYGWRALGVDISPVALHLARAEARMRALTVDLLAANLEDYPLPPAHFDLVCVFRFLERALCPRLATSLKPGGVLIYETFTIEQRSYEGGPRTDDRLLQPGELPRLFPALDVLEYREGVTEEDGRPRALAGLVARRPTDSL